MSDSPTMSNGAGFQTIILGVNTKTTTSGTSQVCSAFTTVAPAVTVFEVFATKDCYLKVGVSPVATLNDKFLPAGIMRQYGVRLGHQVAVIMANEPGILYLTAGA